MMSAESNSSLSWADQNQAYLIAEFAWLRHRLSASDEKDTHETAELESRAEELRARTQPPPAIDVLSELFGLTRFERQLLLLCAGVEMDSCLAERSAEAQGRPGRTNATFGLAMAVLPEPHWSALTSGRPLREFRLVELQPGCNLTTAPIRIDERILHLLAGINMLDQRLEGLVRRSPASDWIADEHKALSDPILRGLEGNRGEIPAIHLRGDDDQGQEDVAKLVAERTGRQLFVLRAEDLPAPGPELSQCEILWKREALLLPAALLIHCGAADAGLSVCHLAERLPGLLFLASREPIRLHRACLRFEVNKPQAEEQKALWQRAVGPAAGRMNGQVDALASHFRLSARTILSTGRLMAREETTAAPDQLWNACRALSRPRLFNLAQRIIPSAGWDDLVLPDAQKRTLRQISSQVRHRMKVYEAWGFAAKSNRGLGVSALFTGESGTGKTMAAEVLARELELDLYRIDLSAVVSKYIGETEKNLKQVFDAAEEGGAILLFDEADALFGKRSDVKDSHDRYANIEVSYLLQRMESYRGLAILTTNLKSAIDRAFQRRLRFRVNFPFPDATQREAIWNRIFPAQTPTQGLDSKRLSQLNVPGGNIRNIALNAAFLAAADGDGTPLEMRHVLSAARFEAEKIERPLAEAEIRGWVA
jgi:AAA+ superfamily predicted ATPase